MSVSIDPITLRKLILVKHLYLQAEKHSGLHYSISNRIMSVIGFDLAVETLLKVIIVALDHKEPPYRFPDLIKRCDDLLSKRSLPSLPNKVQIKHAHSIRNDAQHRAKYPNPTDVSDCRTYTRDFCRETIDNIWSVSFDDISLLEWIDDHTLREVLEIALTDIQALKRKKGLTLAGSAFQWASESISNFLPLGAEGLYGGQVPELAQDTIEYVNAVLKNIEKTSKRFAALMSTGVSVVDYKRFREAIPYMSWIYSSTIQAPDDVRIKVNVQWRSNEPDEETALWVHAFVVDSIINWQALGLAPGIPNEDKKEQAQLLIKWDSNQIKMSDL